MAQEPESLTLLFLRRIDAKVDRLVEDVQDLKTRLTQVELDVAGLRTSMASLQQRMDRLDVRIDRIERRLELIEPAHGK